MEWDEVRQKKEKVENEIARLITEFGKETDMVISGVHLETKNFIRQRERYMIFDYWVILDVRF